MSLALAYPPLPGIWVRRAQDCLDALSAMTTVDEVVAAYGSARAIVTETLGAPIAGGAGTRRAVRATGVLLTHRLGPALAVEALSWAASAAEAVDPATIEAFLEHAASAVAVHRPLRLEDRHVLVGHLAAHPSEAARRRTLYHLWDAGTAHDLPTPPSPRTADDDAAWLHELFADLDDPDELAEWLWLHRDHRDPTAPTPPPRPRVVDVYDAATPDEQAVAFDRLDLGQRAVVAGSHLLFELAEPVVARCLVEHPRHVLTNPACPDGLRVRVRHPYDVATLELALRAGRPHYEPARVRRLLAGLDGAAHDRFLATIPLDYLRALRDCGLNTAEALLHGRLAAVDLTDPGTAAAILGTPDHWPARRLPPDVVDVLVRHPDAAHLTGLLTRNKVVVPHELARRLVDEADPPIADAALWHLPYTALTAADAPIARRAGGYWAARCPGIPADQRPARDLRPAAVDRHAQREDGCYDDEVADRPDPGRADEPFRYPSEIVALQHPYREAPGWIVELPDTPAELRRNAEAMRNCTRGFEPEVRAGRAFVVVVRDPDGRCYKVAVRRHRSGYRVGEINSFANGGHRPAWIRPAFAARLAEPATVVAFTEPPPPARRPTDRRDRRRARASRARRARR